jgi:DNA polymerase-1
VLKKGKTGPSTDSDVLERLAEQHKLPGLILEYREFTKLQNTYVDTLPEMVSPRTGRLHTSFNQTGTATGRLSSSDPNLQNIPIRTELGRSIRRAFIPTEGWKFVSGDYSQIELRMLAHLSGDKAMAGSFSRGEDIHKAVAAEVFGKPLAQVTPQERQVAKTVNFGLVYGQGPQGLSRQTGLSLTDSEAYITRYFERYPGVKKYIDGVISEAEKNGYVQTIAGRRRNLPDITADMAQRRNAARRAAVNTVIQGSAADLIKGAMITLDAELQKRGGKARMLLQIHDELLLEAPPEELDGVESMLKRVMEGAMKLNVPLKVECSRGGSWMELK